MGDSVLRCPGFNVCLTNRWGATHNPTVLRQLRVAIVGLSLAPCVAFSAALPQEHRHEADAHHPRATVHQHFASHDHDGTEVSPGDDGHITWLDRVAAHRTPLPPFAPVRLVVAYLEDFSLPSRWVAVEVLDTAPPHGPPRRSLSLRAPPAPSAFAI